MVTVSRRDFLDHAPMSQRTRPLFVAGCDKLIYCKTLEAGLPNYPAAVHNPIPSRGRILFRLKERHKGGRGKDIPDTIP